MGGGKGKKDVNVKLTFRSMLKYGMNTEAENKIKSVSCKIDRLRCNTNDHQCKTNSQL